MERLIFIFRQITCCYPKKKVIFLHAVHCPLLLINTGLMSIDPLTKELLQKHRPVSYRKKKNKTCTFPTVPYWKLRRERALPAWCTLRRLVRASAYYIERKLWKRRLWNMISFALLVVTLFGFFWGQVDLELLPFIAEYVTNIKN